MSINGVQPAFAAPRFGSGINPVQFRKAMKSLGFELVSGGKHGTHFQRGALSIPFSTGGNTGNIGDPILRTFADQLGVPLKDLKQYIRQPKRTKLNIMA